MLKTTLITVKPASDGLAAVSADLPAAGPSRQTAGSYLTHDTVTTHLFLLILAALAAVLLVLFRWRIGRRQRALRALLDAADALEDRLRTARDEIEAVAGDHIDDPVRDALREMLRQRLWLRDHGAGASPEQLAVVRAAIDAARGRIEHQLARIEEARAPRA